MIILQSTLTLGPLVSFITFSVFYSFKFLVEPVLYFAWGRKEERSWINTFIFTRVFLTWVSILLLKVYTFATSMTSATAAGNVQRVYWFLTWCELWSASHMFSLLSPGSGWGRSTSLAPVPWAPPPDWFRPCRRRLTRTPPTSPCSVQHRPACSWTGR